MRQHVRLSLVLAATASLMTGCGSSNSKSSSTVGPPRITVVQEPRVTAAEAAQARVITAVLAVSAPVSEASDGFIPAFKRCDAKSIPQLEKEDCVIAYMDRSGRAITAATDASPAKDVYGLASSACGIPYSDEFLPAVDKALLAIGGHSMGEFQDLLQHVMTVGTATIKACGPA
ncbi:MAG: hypothetical protein JWM31_838 [Solirubrobacterales bacterium]|nr:hypothetical protein [Solirubrobacterales bacterium]